MNKIDELIQQYCPEGVEYVPLHSIASQFSGMTGVSNKWAESGNCLFIDYMNVYKNISVDVSALKNATVKSLRQNILQKGDILFTSASETPDECALAAVIEKDIPENVFLDDHLFGLRLFDKRSNRPSYLKYAFHSNYFRTQVRKVVRGVTRNYVSKVDFMNLEIPLPPLPVQEAIVNILDRFAEYTAELQAELQARQQQYNYYRDTLLSFEGRVDVQWKKLGEIEKCHCSGSTPTKSKKEYYDNGTIPWLRTQDVKFNEITEVDSFITELAVKETSVKWIPENCVIVAISGATAGRCAINKIKTTTNQHCLNIEIDDRKALYKYVFYCVCNQYDELISLKQGARGDLNSSSILNVKIPVPSLSEQQRIVNILDRFDRLINDLSQGLPAEIEARQQQYEYYRDQLLTFKRM